MYICIVTTRANLKKKISKAWIFYFMYIYCIMYFMFMSIVNIYTIVLVQQSFAERRLFPNVSHFPDCSTRSLCQLGCTPCTPICFPIRWFPFVGDLVIVIVSLLLLLFLMFPAFQDVLEFWILFWVFRVVCFVVLVIGLILQTVNAWKKVKLMELVPQKKWKRP